MASLPSALALTTIADSSAIVAVDHRNNYAAIQTDVNQLITCLSGGGAGQVLGLSGTTLTPVYPPGFELTYDELTSNVTGIVATTAGTATTVKASSSFTFDGSTVWVEFFAPELLNTTTGSTVLIELFQDATDLGTMGGATISTNGGATPALLKRRVTPAAGSHTFTVKAFVSAGSGSVSAGAGGSAGTLVPAYIRVTKA